MQNVGLFANPQKKILHEKLPSIIQLMKDEGLNVLCPKESNLDHVFHAAGCKMVSAKDIPESSDVIFTFGGDGTVLRTVQVVKEHETPILTVNVGGLGFLTEVLLDNFNEALKSVLRGDYQIENRLVLEGKINTDDNPMYALNEITIEKGRSPRVIEVKIDINGRYFNDYIADGLIISTPTGSTGYSLSSGGPIVVPTSHCVILNPICPHSLTNRPVIIPDESNLKAQIYTDFPELIISADSQDIRQVRSKTVIHIQKASFYVKLIKYTDSDYFSLLRNKLSWGEDFRNKLRWSQNK